MAINCAHEKFHVDRLMKIVMTISETTTVTTTPTTTETTTPTTTTTQSTTTTTTPTTTTGKLEIATLKLKVFPSVPVESK